MYKLTIQSVDGATITHEHETLDVLKREGGAYAAHAIDNEGGEMPDIEYMVIECTVTGKSWLWVDDAPGFWDDGEV